jgi:hypothetical protein
VLPTIIQSLTYKPDDADLQFLLRNTYKSPRRQDDTDRAIE